MKHDPRLARPQPPQPAVQAPSNPLQFEARTDGFVRPVGTAPAEDSAEARRLWALGLIATCSNQSVLFGEVPTEERIAAAKEVLRLSRLPPRILK